MNYGNLLYDVPPTFRELIRNLEKENKKLIRAEWSQKFNISCLNENIKIITFYDVFEKKIVNLC